MSLSCSKSCSPCFQTLGHAMALTICPPWDPPVLTPGPAMLFHTSVPCPSSYPPLHAIPARPSSQGPAHCSLPCFRKHTVARTFPHGSITRFWSYLCPTCVPAHKPAPEARDPASVLLLVLRPELAPLMSGTRSTELLVGAQPPQASQWTPARALGGRRAGREPHFTDGAVEAQGSHMTWPWSSGPCLHC